MDDDFFTRQTRRETRRSERRRAARRRRLALLGAAAAVAAVAALAVILATGDGQGGNSGDGAPDAAASAASTTASSPTDTAAATDATADAQATPALETTQDAAPSPTPSPRLRRPTARDPLRVYFGGDSLSGMPGVMFAQRAQRTGLMKVTVDYQTSSRLTVADPVDWPARLRAQIGARRYDAAAFMIGINDTGMPMLVDGTSVMYPKKAWLREYRDRVDELTRVMLKAGAERVYWVGLPVMPQRGQNEAVEDLNALFEEVAAGDPDVVYVDTYPVLATGSGGFDPSLRSGDGVHFTNEGATRLADAVWRAMRDDWRRP